MLDFDAAELRGRYPDDPVRRSFGGERAPDNRAIAAAAILPVTVAEDRDSGLPGNEESSERGLHSEYVEVVGRDAFHARNAAALQAGPARTAAGQNAVEEISALCQFQVKRRRYEPGSAGAGLEQVDQFARIRHRQGAQHQRLEHGEERGVGADPQRERENRGDGEPGLARKSAQRLPYRPQRRLDPVHAALFAVLLRRLRNAAEFAQRRGTRALRIHSLAQEFLFLQGQVSGDFLLQFALQAAIVEQG